ncbi:hypothetical protein [Holzapfeliella sp. JNUCC 80]
MIEFAEHEINIIYKNSTYYMVKDLTFMFDISSDLIELYFDINAHDYTTTYGSDLYVSMEGMRQMLLKTKATVTADAFNFLKLEKLEPLGRKELLRFKALRDLASYVTL